MKRILFFAICAFIFIGFAPANNAAVQKARVVIRRVDIRSTPTGDELWRHRQKSAWMDLSEANNISWDVAWDDFKANDGNSVLECYVEEKRSFWFIPLPPKHGQPIIRARTGRKESP